MTLQSWLVHPAMYVIALVPLTFYLVSLRSGMSWGAFRVFFLIEAPLVMGVTGLVYGTIWVKKITASWNGEWSGAFNAAGIVVFIAIFLISLDRLGKKDGMVWIPVSLGTYSLGSLIRLGLTWGDA